MQTIELTDGELRIVRAALQSYLDDFGHEEADVLREIKAVLAKLPGPEPAARAMTAEKLTVERLAELLREAERAHGAYEQDIGRRDEDWPTWYAQYLHDRLSTAE